MTPVEWGYLLIGFGIGIVIGSLLGSLTQWYDWVDKSIKAGVMEYDAITGKPKWKH